MTLPEEYLRIDTPENVAFGYDVAGIGSRFLAAIVDTLLIIILQVVVNLTLLLLITNLFADPFGSRPAIWMIAVFSLISFIFFWGYYIIFEVVWNGQSPGKRWVGLRVLRSDGAPITLAEAIIRNLVRLIDFLPAYYGIGVATMFIDARSRRLGDLAAGTLVVYDRRAITLESLAAAPAASVSARELPAEVTGLPLERLTEPAIQMVEDFLARRLELSTSYALTNQLTETLYQQMELPPPETTNRHREQLLVDIVQAYRRRQASP